MQTKDKNIVSLVSTNTDRSQEQLIVLQVLRPAQKCSYPVGCLYNLLPAR